MDKSYSIDHIAEDHIHTDTDMKCNIEEQQQRYCLETASK